MVTPGQTTTRAYDILRHRIVTLELRPGVRIDPVLVADELGCSITPVRDGLHILAGEGLVEIRHGEGYFIPRVDEAALKDLYEWNLDLLLAAHRRGTLHSAKLPDPVDDAVVSTAALFAAIARASSNKVHAVAMRWTNARLGPARQIEGRNLFDLRGEVAAITKAIASEDGNAARKLLSTYHAGRKRMAKAIAEALQEARSGEADI
jgi:DNA-binding GntR family transcriptional regulator